MNKGNKYRKIFLLISVIGFFNISDKEAAIVSPSTPIQEGINTAKNGLITWFDDSIPAQGWSYSYGGSTKLEIIGADEKARGKIIKASFDDRAYSGVTIARGISYDLTSLRNTGALRFRVKGGQGGERFYIGILDDESDKKDKKIQAKLYSEDFFNVSKEWQQVEIRLSEFPQIGEWWDNKKNAAGVDDIDWSKILEIRFSTDKEANTMQCTADHLAAIFIDGIEITGSSAAPIKPRIDRWWKRK